MPLLFPHCFQKQNAQIALQRNTECAQCVGECAHSDGHVGDIGVCPHMTDADHFSGKRVKRA